jgi:RNA polymerase sigma-70 factor (ECF subfamily)
MATAHGPHGDAELLARWVREHGSAVRAFLLGLVRRADVADDLLQDVFRRAWQARRSYQEQGRERAYLLRIADRLVCDRGRRMGVEVTVDEQAWQQLEPESEQDSPLDAMARHETSDELTAALSALSNSQRRVLLLRYFSDLDFAAIANQMDIPLNTALSHARRGLLALRKQLAERTT